ncbi:MAG: tetratricopeptide repeat protein [Pseudomonadota bacterium]
MRASLFFLVSSVFCAALTPPASASSTFLGNGMGKACFDAVRLGTTSNKDLQLCTDALVSGTLTGKDLPATYVNRGIILMRMERYKDALSDYERALDYNPALAEAKINMGAALIGLRRYASAIGYLESGLEEGPISPHIAHYNLGIAHEQIGDYQNARAHYASAVSVAPEWSPALRKLESLPLPYEPAASGESESR